MKNIEKQIIKRLNGVLNKYNLIIISKNNHNYKTTISVDDIFKKYCYKYVLVKIKNDTIIDCYFTWSTIKRILLESSPEQSLFKIINNAHDSVKYYIERDVEPTKTHILIDKLYNELGFLNNCSSYEELIIKMDLLRI